MTHAPAPHDEGEKDAGGGGGGGGGGGSVTAAGAAKEDDEKQVRELLSPPPPPGALRGSPSSPLLARDEDGPPSSSSSAVQRRRGVGDAQPRRLPEQDDDEEDAGGGGGRGAPQSTRARAPHPPMPTPPDGGWGWVVVFASFMIHIVNDGVTYSFGIFYDALIEYFNSGRGETAWILSILVGVTLCSGPISSSFVNRYGCRPVTIAGALLGAASLAVSVFAPNVQTLYVTIGLGTGFGFGLVYLPAIVSVTCYFERLRSLATGIAVCGSGLGTFLLAPATKELVKRLGWRQALLWVSVMVLSCVIYGSLFRPLRHSATDDGGGGDAAAAAAQAEDNGGRGPPPKDDDTTQSGEVASVEEEQLLQTKRTPAVTNLFLMKEEASSEGGETPLQHAASERDIASSLHAPPLKEQVKQEAAAASSSLLLHRPRSVGHLASGGGSGGSGGSAMSVPCPRGGSGAGAAHRGGGGGGGGPGPAARLAQSQPTLSFAPLARPSGTDTRLATTPSMYRRTGSGIMYRKDILYSGSVHNLLEHQSASHLHAEAARLLSDDHASPPPSANGVAAPPAALDASAGGGDGAKVAKQKKACGCLKLSAETADTLREMLDFSLLKDPIFILFTVSNFLTSIGYNVPYLYVAVQAKSRGLDDSKAGWLLAAIGFANTIGRIVLGYISDKPWVNRLLVYNLCLTICGIATAFSALCESYESFMLYACVFGCTIGAYVGLTSVVLVDLLGLDRLTNAFGLLLLFQGIASLIGPPIAGWLYDALESYDPGFIVAGVTMALSGVMLFAIPPVQRRLRLKAAAAGNPTVLELRPQVNGSAPMVHA